MFNKFKVLLLVLIAASFISGCAQGKRDMYYWGEYETLLQDMYINPGSAEFDVQIEKLNTDIQQAANKGLRTPPGVYAHLGYLYVSQGDAARGRKAFEAEKNLYPESAVFIDGMMKRAFKRG